MRVQAYVLAGVYGTSAESPVSPVLADAGPVIGGAGGEGATPIVQVRLREHPARRADGDPERRRARRFAVVKVIWRVPWPDVIVPLSSVQAYVEPAPESGTDATMPGVPAQTDGGTVMTTASGPRPTTIAATPVPPFVHCVSVMLSTL